MSTLTNREPQDVQMLGSPAAHPSARPIRRRIPAVVFLGGLLLTFVGLCGCSCDHRRIQVVVIDLRGDRVRNAGVQVDDSLMAYTTDAGTPKDAIRWPGTKASVWVRAEADYMAAEPVRLLRPAAWNGTVRAALTLRTRRDLSVRVEMRATKEGAPPRVPGVTVYERVVPANTMKPPMSSMHPDSGWAPLGITDAEGVLEARVGCEEGEQLFVWAGSGGYYPVREVNRIAFEGGKKRDETVCVVDPQCRLKVTYPQGSGSTYSARTGIGGDEVNVVMKQLESDAITFWVRYPLQTDLSVELPAPPESSAWQVRRGGASSDWRREGRSVSWRFSSVDEIGSLEVSAVRDTFVPNVPAPISYYRFDSDPSGAAILFIDGERIGRTPIEESTSPGVHRVRLEPRQPALHGPVNLADYPFPRNTPPTRLQQTLTLPLIPEASCSKAAELVDAGDFEGGVKLALAVPFRSDPSSEREYRCARLLAVRTLVDKSKDKLRAIAVLQEAVQSWPTEPELQLELGVLRCDVRRHDEAIRNLLAARENAYVYQGAIRLYILNKAQFYLGRSYDGLYRQSQDVSHCLAAYGHFRDFCNKVNAGDPQLGGLVSSAREWLDENQKSPCK